MHDIGDGTLVNPQHVAMIGVVHRPRNAIDPTRGFTIVLAGGHERTFLFGNEAAATLARTALWTAVAHPGVSPR